jgi:Uma2 family endonuclease
MSSTLANELELEDFPSKATQNVVLTNISWQTYQSLLAEMGDHRATRLSYDRQTLYIKMPSKLHEIINRLLARIVTTLTEELDLNVINLGSTTLDREDLQRGAEPDTCFYIQHADQLAGLDPEIPEGLPPDLAIEVDITSFSNRRLEVYLALGIPEIWCYTKQQGLKIYHCQINESGRNYLSSEVSLAFPQVSAAVLNQFLQQRQTQNENTVIRAVRSWIQSQL